LKVQQIGNAFQQERDLVGLGVRQLRLSYQQPNAATFDTIASMNYNIHPLLVHFPVAFLAIYSLIKIIPVSKWFPHISWKHIEITLFIAPMRTLWRLPAFDILKAQCGGIVGETQIVGCINGNDPCESPWFTGEWGFVLRDSKILPFRPCTGALGIFNVP
jgi:hypothetical protein